MQELIERFVTKILMGRKICRTFGNQPIFGIYAEIYEQARQKLVYEVTEYLSQNSKVNILQVLNQQQVPEWANELRNRTFQNLLDDNCLKQLAIAAQSSNTPTQTQRRYAMGELIQAILLSRRLKHPHQSKFPVDLYQLIYADGLNRTLLLISQSIDKYKPEKSFINWVNFRLYFEILNSYQQMTIPLFPRLTRIYPKEDIDFPPPINFDTVCIESLRQFIETDKFNHFKNRRMNSNPCINCQIVLLALLDGGEWQDIVLQMKLGDTPPNLGQISKFFHRCCQYFRNELRDAC